MVVSPQKSPYRANSPSWFQMGRKTPVKEGSEAGSRASSSHSRLSRVSWAIRDKVTKSPRAYYLLLVLILGLGTLSWRNHLQSAAKSPIAALDTSSTISTKHGHTHVAAGHTTDTTAGHTHTSEPASSEHQPLGVPWAITYSPLHKDGTCKSLPEMAADMVRLQATGAQAVRLYSTDCGVLEAVDPTTKKNKKACTKQLSLHNKQHMAKPVQKLELNVIAGLFPYVVEEEDQQDTSPGKWLQSLDDQLHDLAQWGRWSRVSILTVGSSGVFDDTYTVPDLVNMIGHVKRRLADLVPEQDKKYVPLVTTAEPVQSYVSVRRSTSSVEQYKTANDAGDDKDKDNDDDLCAVVDVIGLTVQPFFNSAISPDDAGALLQRDVKLAHYLCSDAFLGSSSLAPTAAPTDFAAATGTAASAGAGKAGGAGKEVVVLEAGWPSAGQANGEAMPGRDEQYHALRSILSARDPLATASSGSEKGELKTVLYAFEDEKWREPGVLSVETHFGVEWLFQ